MLIDFCSRNRPKLCIMNTWFKILKEGNIHGEHQEIAVYTNWITLLFQNDTRTV